MSLLNASVELVLQAPECMPFRLALAVMAGIGVLELLALLLGAGLGGVFDALFPDLDLHLELHEASLLERALGWLGAGRVPVLMILVAALTWFGVTGLGVQVGAAMLSGSPLPGVAASALGLVVTLPLTRLTSGLIARVIEHGASSAVSRRGFVGQVATMLQGEARRGAPSQARLQDRFGQRHYVLVEPEDDGVVLEPGEQVLLVRQAGAHFTAIRNPLPLLSREESLE